MKRVRYLAVLCGLLLVVYGECSNKVPLCTVVIVLDQCPYRHIPQLSPYLSGGIGKLLRHGVIFTRAHHPHGVPETTPGHHALSTGALPKDHGAVTNSWIDVKHYTKIPYDGDQEKSPSQTMVDGLSDAFMRSAEQNRVYAFSLKTYPAISCANHTGTAIWFDARQGKMTSASYYTDSMLELLHQFNQEHSLDGLNACSWDPVYPADHRAYQFPQIDNYAHAGYPFRLAGNQNIPIDRTSDKPFDLFMKTPAASQLLFDCARFFVHHHYEKNPTSPLLLWVSLSNLDLVGHFYGPQSKEVIDTMYHLDQQLDSFLSFLSKKVGASRLLVALASDHGIAPIPEVVQAQGYRPARRIMANDLMKRMNARYREVFRQSDDLIKAFEPSSFYLNADLCSKLAEHDRRQAEDFVVDYLMHEPGIARVWRASDLAKAAYQDGMIERAYQNQLYKDRVGDIIVQPEPYCLVTHYPTGTSHMTGYYYDTHVPLIMYQKKKFHHKRIHRPVIMQQLPVTLAALLGIEKPSAAVCQPLPGIGDYEN